MTGERGAIYGRVSTDDQRGNYSIPTQIAACVKHATARGYAVVGDRFIDTETGQDCAARDGASRAYVDDYSSRELSRPALDAALSFAERTGFDVLIVHAIDRLARDPYIRQTLEREFSKWGVRVEFVIGDYAETAEGEVRKDLDSTFAKWENAKRVERMNRGKIGKAERGRYVTGGGPYGYTPDTQAPGGLAVNRAQADTAQWMFDQIVNHGQSLRGVATALNAKGIASPRGLAWTFVTVDVIIRNETYAGTSYYNVRKRQNGRTVIRDRAEWIAITVTPIIDRGTWAAAQQQLKDNGTLKRRPTKRFYLLSGMIQCADCGRAYVAQADGGAIGCITIGRVTGLAAIIKSRPTK